MNDAAHFARRVELDVRLGERGVAAAVLAAAAVAVGCSSAPSKSPEQERADAATAARVYAALEANPVYFFRDVEVSVDYGVAQLSGYVWTTDALYGAERIARRVPGVTGIRDTMELERQGNRGGGDGGGGQ
jgi:osmotically-inducible protein OsmY